MKGLGVELSAWECPHRNIDIGFTGSSRYVGTVWNDNDKTSGSIKDSELASIRCVPVEVPLRPL